MIDQIICAIGGHVLPSEKEKFYSHRLGLNKFNKIIAAKNNLSSYLHQTNRKGILKQLVTKK